MSHRTRHIGDLFLIFGTVVLAAVLWLAFSGGQAGNLLTVTTPSGMFSLSLSQDTVRPIAGRNGYTLTLSVQDGRVCVSQADCPDKLCVHSGWIGRSGQVIACVPAGITVRVEGETEVDAVAR